MTQPNRDDNSTSQIDITRQKGIKTLHALLIISFINTGMWALSHLTLGFLGPETRTTMMDVYQTLAEKNENYSAFAIMCEKLFAVPQWYYLICALLDAVSFGGMLLMWRIRKNGFHSYTLAKLLLMLMPLLFLDRSYLGIGEMMMAVLFIVYYFFLMRSLGAFSSSATPSIPSTPED